MNETAEKKVINQIAASLMDARNRFDWIVSSSKLGVDTFVFCPTVEGQEEEQLRLFVEGVIPRVRAGLAENIT